MSTKREEYEARCHEEKKRATRFKHQLNGLRGARERYYFRDEKFAERLVVFASETFETPNERLQYALPALLNPPKTDSLRLYSNRKTILFDALEKWELSDSARANLAVANNIADNSSFFSLSRFTDEIGEMVRKVLPRDKHNIVFRKAVDNSVRLHNDNVEEQAQTLATIAREYVAQDKWPAAYNHLKQRCFHSLTRPNRWGNRELDMDQLIQAAELLGKFASNLPLSAAKKESAFDGISGWMNETEKHFPGIKISDSLYSSTKDKTILLYESKKALCPQRLDEEDYKNVLKRLKTKQQEQYMLYHDIGLKDKIKILSECAECCLPDKKRKTSFVSDLLTMVRGNLEEQEFRNVDNVVLNTISALRDLKLTNKRSLSAFEAIETILNNASIAGKINDKYMLDVLGRASENLLGEKERLSWLNKLTDKPFLYAEPNDNKTVIPFLSFLHSQFEAAAKGKTKGELISTKNVAARHINGKLILAFSPAVSNGNGGEGVLIYNNGDVVTTENDMRKQVDAMSSVPAVHREHVERFYEMINAID